MSSSKDEMIHNRNQKRIKKFLDLKFVFMIELNRLIGYLFDKEDITNITTAISKRGEIRLNSFNEDAQPIQLDTPLPIGNLMEVFISCYLAENSDHLNIPIREGVSNLLPGFNLVEEQFSIKYISVGDLLSHTSGLANIRNRRDITLGRLSSNVSYPKDIIPLHKYFSYPVTMLQSPGNIVVQNDIDYALVARIIESRTGKDFKRVISDYLDQYIPGISPYDTEFIRGSTFSPGMPAKIKLTPLRYYHLYPSKMAGMSLGEVLTLLHTLLFKHHKSEQIRDLIFHQYHNPSNHTDSTCFPFRNRKNLGIYQLISQAHGYTLNLVIHPDSETIAIVAMNLDSQRSSYFTGKVLREICQTVSGFPDLEYTQSLLEVSEEQVAALDEKYLSYRPSILSNLFNDQIGGGIQFRLKNNQLYVTNLTDGVFFTSTRYSRRFHLRPLLMENNTLVLGFDDGFYYSKIIVPSSTKAPIVYAELDHGPSIFFKSTHRNIVLINFRQNFEFFLQKRFINTIQRIKYEIQHELRDETRVQRKSIKPLPYSASTKLDLERTSITQSSAGTTSHLSQIPSSKDIPREKREDEIKPLESDKYPDRTTSDPYGDEEDVEEIVGEKTTRSIVSKVLTNVNIILRAFVSFFVSIPILLGPFFNRMPHDFKNVLLSIGKRLGRALYLVKSILQNFGEPINKETTSLKSITNHHLNSIYVKVTNRIALLSPQFYTQYKMSWFGFLNWFQKSQNRIDVYNQTYPQQITFDFDGLHSLRYFIMKTIRPKLQSLYRLSPYLVLVVTFIVIRINNWFANTKFNVFKLHVYSKFPQFYDKQYHQYIHVLQRSHPDNLTDGSKSNTFQHNQIAGSSEVKSNHPLSDKQDAKEIINNTHDYPMNSPQDNRSKSIDNLKTVNSRFRDRLISNGFNTPLKIAESSVEELTKIKGIGEKTAEKLMEEAENYTTLLLR